MCAKAVGRTLMKLTPEASKPLLKIFLIPIRIYSSKMIMKTKRGTTNFLMSKMHLCSPSGNDRMIAISKKKTKKSFNTIIRSLLTTFDVRIFLMSFPRPETKLATS